MTCETSFSANFNAGGAVVPDPDRRYACQKQRLVANLLRTMTARITRTGPSITAITARNETGLVPGSDQHFRSASAVSVLPEPPVTMLPTHITGIFGAVGRRPGVAQRITRAPEKPER